MVGRRITRAADAAALITVLLILVAPVAWVTLSAFKPRTEVAALPPRLLFTPTLENFTELFGRGDFLEYTWNSLVVAAGSTALGLALGFPATFAMAWHRISWPATATLFARMAPGTLFLLPWLVMFTALGLTGGRLVLVLTHAAITLPVVIWVLLPYMDGIPRELIESAQIDGARARQILSQVVLPSPCPASSSPQSSPSSSPGTTSSSPSCSPAWNPNSHRRQLQLRRRRRHQLGRPHGRRRRDRPPPSGDDRANPTPPGRRTLSRSSKGMKAARFTGEGQITVAEQTDPTPANGEVTVRVAACALCGSDLRPWRQGWRFTPGHEIAGRVDHPNHPRHGERVAIYIPVFCGHCPMCRTGRTHLCETSRELVGWQRNGGYAEALAVPERCLLPIPDDVPDHLAPLLLDTIGTTAHGIRLAQRLVDHGPALVLGAGPIGLGAILVLRRMGFGPIAVVDPIAYRTTFAATLGSTPITPETAAATRYALVIEATGKDPARQIALEAVQPEGVIIQLGESDTWSVTETRSIRLKDFFLLRSFYFPIADFADNVELLRADRADYERLVDGRANLDGLETLFAAFARGERLKPVMLP